MFWHSDEFIERVKQLADECPALEGDIANAYTGGHPQTDGLKAFLALQDRIAERNRNT